MNIIDIDEAVKKRCPFKIAPNCVASECMAWQKSFDRIEREDHSGGASSYMQSTALSRRQTIKREGPSGCSGIMILEEAGYCARCAQENTNNG